VGANGKGVLRAESGDVRMTIEFGKENGSKECFYHKAMLRGRANVSAKTVPDPLLLTFPENTNRLALNRATSAHDCPAKAQASGRGRGGAGGQFSNGALVHFSAPDTGALFDAP
jgi:hypothetical protein